MGDDKKRTNYDKIFKEKRTISKEEIEELITKGEVSLEMLVAIAHSEMFESSTRNAAGFRANQIFRELGMVEELFRFIKDKNTPQVIRKEGWRQIDQCLHFIEDDLLSRMVRTPEVSQDVKRQYIVKSLDRLIEELDRKNKFRELLIIAECAEIGIGQRTMAGRKAIEIMRRTGEELQIATLATDRKYPPEVRERACKIAEQKIAKEIINELVRRLERAKVNRKPAKTKLRY